MQRFVLIATAGICLSHTLAAAEPPDAELKAVNRMGCKEFEEDRLVKRFIAGCTKALGRSDLTDRQRAYAYFVRGTLYSTSAKHPEARADYEQSIALNPYFGPVYDWRAILAQTKEEGVRDYQKALELGYTAGFAEFSLKGYRAECPSLVFKGNACQPPGGGSSPIAQDPLQPATDPPFVNPGETLYTCPENIIWPEGCKLLLTLSKDGVQIYPWVVCQPGVVAPSTCQPRQPRIAAAGTTPAPAPLASPPALPSPPPQAAPPPPPEVGPEPEKPGWFSWLWGSKKPAPQPSGIPRPSADGPTIPAEIAETSLTLVSPTLHCLEDRNSELLRLLIAKILFGGKPPAFHVLGGYKECPGQDTFYTSIGAYFTPDISIFDYRAGGDRIRQSVAEFCAGGDGVTYISPTGTLDDATAAKLDEAAKASMASVDGYVNNGTIIGMRGPACYMAQVWTSGQGDNRLPRLNLAVNLMLRDRVVFLTSDSLYLGADRAKQDYTVLTQMVDRMQALNP